MDNSFICLGVNTGNSLDAVDVVVTKFKDQNIIEDLLFHTVEFQQALKEKLRSLRGKIENANGNVAKVVTDYPEGRSIIEEYTTAVAKVVNSAITELKKTHTLDVDLIGFHGQTCAHFPPSVATKQGSQAYTVQVGDGQLLANLTNTTVVFDFRSDDIMNGGEGAPLAPTHHRHLAELTQQKGHFPIAFCNAGNTGNISIISGNKESVLPTMGWDLGPFNDYPDLLCRNEKNEYCDLDGKWGSKGKVNLTLLEILFEKAAITEQGENFLLLMPPKSSDPQWYARLPELVGTAKVNREILAFEDRVRTAEYFAAYVYVHGLHMLPHDYPMPTNFALCGGGWNNPVIRNHFIGLLQGDFDSNPILPAHQKIFKEIHKRLGDSVTVETSSYFGFDGHAMEARIFADAAVSRLRGEAFSFPESTGVREATILGIIRFPQNDIANASERVQKALSRSGLLELTEDKNPTNIWSRASAC